MKPIAHCLGRGFFRVLVFVAWSIYKVGVRPFLVGQCRFDPDCSTYAHGVLVGTPFFTAVRLIGKRLIRCHPFGCMEYDPVPSPLPNPLSHQSQRGPYG